MDENLFKVFGIPPETIFDMSVPDIISLVKVRYHALSWLTHTDSPDCNQTVAQHSVKIQQAYEDAETPALLAEQLAAWLAPLRRAAGQDLNSKLRDSFKESMAKARQSRVEDPRDPDIELNYAQRAISAFLIGRLLVKDNYQSDVREVRPPFRMMLSAQLSVGVQKQATRSDSRSRGNYVAIGKTQAESKARGDYFQYRLHANGSSDLLPLQMVTVTKKMDLTSVPPEWNFSFIDGQDRKTGFILTNPAGLTPQPCNLRPVGRIDTQTPVENPGALKRWYHRLLSPHPESDDLKYAVHGFPWHRFVNIVPYMTPVLITRSPLVAIDPTDEDPIFRVFTAMLAYHQLE